MEGKGDDGVVVGFWVWLADLMDGGLGLVRWMGVLCGAWL